MQFSAQAQEKSKPNKIKVSRGDTINYKCFYSDYRLMKVLKNKIEVPHYCNKYFLQFQPDSNTLSTYEFPSRKMLKLTDTVCTINWILENGWNCMRTNCVSYRHSLPGLIRVNIHSNVLVIEKIVCKQDRSEVRVMFKIIKLTSSELIIEELGSKYAPIKYYFIPNYNTFESTDFLNR